MRAPEFWAQDGLIAHLLDPVSLLWRAGTAIRRMTTPRWQPTVPVVCIGNLVAGGAGKTPVAIAIARRLKERGEEVEFVTKGYRGRARGPIPVDLATHDAALVGDEALLLARAAPCWIAESRRDGIFAAGKSGASCVVLDDGFQDPSIAVTLSLLVVDAEYGFGNGRVIPAGPLREPIADGLARADAVILIGDDAGDLTLHMDRPPVLKARIRAAEAAAAALRGQRVLAFAGIGRPRKFFDTLAKIGAELVETHGFADHHPYNPDELMRLVDRAHALDALAVTTEKDLVRIPYEARPMVKTLPIEVVFDDPVGLDALLDEAKKLWKAAHHEH